MKIIIDMNNNVFFKMPNKKSQFLFEKEKGYPIKRRSQYSFIYMNRLYDCKRGISKEII